MQADRLSRIFLFLSNLIAHHEVEGLDRLPQDPYILAVNHLGMMDVVYVYGLVGNPNMTGWAAEKYEHHLFFGSILRSGGAIFIQRGQVDRAALDAAVTWLKQGKSFGMAPEGTRSATRSLARGKTGVAYLAAESGAPVVPAALTGTEAVAESLLRLRRAQFRLRIGSPVQLPPLSSDGRTADLRRNTDEVMCRIAAMLPPAYRGEYADHPRTQALLAAGYGELPLEGRAPAAAD